MGMSATQDHVVEKDQQRRFLHQEVQEKKKVENTASTGSARSRANTILDSSSSPSLRKTEAMTKKQHKVMFTGYNDQKDVKIVKELGGSTTDAVSECTVLVTDQIRRTAKFLSMVGKGIPIVGPKWLSDSKLSGKFLNPWDFILHDPANEKKWGFDLSKTLTQANKARLLAGKSIGF